MQAGEGSVSFQDVNEGTLMHHITKHPLYSRLYTVTKPNGQRFVTQYTLIIHMFRHST